MTSRRWSNVTKIIVAATLVLFVIFLVIMFRAMIPPTIVAFLLAFILGYPVNWIQRQTGWARRTAVVVLYVLLLGMLAIAPVLFIPRAITLATSLRATFEELVAQLQSASTGLLVTFGDFDLSPDQLLQQVGEILQNVLLGTANPFLLFRNVTYTVLTVLYVLVLNFWLLSDLHKVRRAIYDQIPPDYQGDVSQLAEELSQTWQAFLRGQILLALVVGVIAWVPLVIVGMPNAGGLAVLAGLMEFVPGVGNGISGTVGTLLALFQGSTWLQLPGGNVTFALVVMVIYMVIAQVESIYLVPKLVGGRVNLHPGVAFVGIIAGALVFGVLGVLLASPVIASSRIIFRYIYRKLLDLEPFEPQRAAQTAVRIPGLIAGRKVEAIVFDLDGTLAAVDWGASRSAVSYFYWLERIAPAEQRRQIARRLMVAFEGIVNFLTSQIHRYGWRTHPRAEPVLRTLNRLRGYPPDDQIEPLPVAVTALPRLAQNYPLALITIRSSRAVEHFLECAGLPASLFATVVTGDDVRNLLPHSEGLVATAERLGMAPGQLLMVSDTELNLRAARAMEMATAGVLTGLGQAEDLNEADIIVPSVAELEEWL
jgi:predicted PurR-regulated permease PerM/phosphoglycolate phosphatase-like HAD superfamily hydrolase